MTHAAKPGLPQFGFATICRSKSEKIVIAVRCRSCNALKNPPHDFVESIRIDATTCVQM
jgi:hypothetical protein